MAYGAVGVLKIEPDCGFARTGQRMGFLNLGKKDEYGRQRRVEHRGRYLRASRTGGVALRAQTKAAGLTLTGNTARGVRVSATPARNTQVALQNGRFVLRGRYGSGPLSLNLSKSGLSLSARNALGSFNLTNPLRSSAKIAGVQVRGRTAAVMQGIYGVFVLALFLLRAAVVVGLFAFRVLLFLLGLLLRGGAAIPVLVREWRRRRQVARLERLADSIEGDYGRFGEWTSDRWIAALLLAAGAWGRGEAATDVADRLVEALASGDGDRGLSVARDALGETAEVLEALRDRLPAGGDGDLAFVVVVARHLGSRLPVATLAEMLFEVDELLLRAGPRTRLQDGMIEVFADCAGLRLAPDEAGQDAPARSGTGSEKEAAGAIDINTADIETLQSIPHVGEERARAIADMRPLGRLEDLTAVDGIGPKTLQAIREHGVVCDGAGRR